MGQRLWGSARSPCLVRVRLLSRRWDREGPIRDGPRSSSPTQGPTRPVLPGGPCPAGGVLLTSSALMGNPQRRESFAKRTQKLDLPSSRTWAVPQLPSCLHLWLSIASRFTKRLHKRVSILTMFRYFPQTPVLPSLQPTINTLLPKDDLKGKRTAGSLASCTRFPTAGALHQGRMPTLPYLPLRA